MNSKQPRRLKVGLRRLEPLKTLPNLKRLAEEAEAGGDKTEGGGGAAFFASGTQALATTKDAEKTAQEGENGELKTGPAAKSVEFVLQNQKHVICKELLREGYLDAFHDFYGLLVAGAERLGAKTQTVEKGMGDLRDSLVRAEEETAKGGWLRAVGIYTDVAEKFLEARVEEAARYFYQKVTGFLQTLLAEGKLDSEAYLARFISAKLGLVKCFDFDRESEAALAILEEIYAKAGTDDRFREDIAAQLVSLYTKLGEVAEGVRAPEAAVEVYRKCAEVCVASGMPKEEFTVVLRMGAVLKTAGRVQEAIELVQTHRQKNVRLPREVAALFEIFSFRLLAECFEAQGDLEEAENNYRSFYELLKTSEEHREALGGKPSLKLGDLFWRKENRKEGLKYYQEYFEEGLRARTKVRETVNHARVTLCVAKGFDEFESFLEYFQMSRHRVEDMLAFKRNRKLL